MPFDDRRNQQPPENASEVVAVNHQLDILLRTEPLGDPTSYLIEFTEDATPVVQQKIICVAAHEKGLDGLKSITDAIKSKDLAISKPVARQQRSPEATIYNPLTQPVRELDLRKKRIEQKWGGQPIKDEGIQIIDVTAQLFGHHLAAKREVLSARQLARFEKTPPAELSDPQQIQEWMLNEAIKFAGRKARNLQLLTDENTTLTQEYAKIRNRLRKKYNMNERDLQILLKLLFIGDHEFVLGQDYSNLLADVLPIIAKGNLKPFTIEIDATEKRLIRDKNDLNVTNWQPDLRNRFIRSVTGNFTQI